MMSRTGHQIVCIFKSKSVISVRKSRNNKKNQAINSIKWHKNDEKRQEKNRYHVVSVMSDYPFWKKKFLLI